MDTQNPKDHWVPALQMSYDYHPRTGMIVFTDGIKYTLEEFMIMAKGRLYNDDDIRAIHEVKKMFDGELVDEFCRGTAPAMPGHDGNLPEKISVPPVRPVLQEFYGRRKPRSKPFDDPCQGVLEL